MTGCIRVFCPEGWPESVNITQCQCSQFPLKLAGYSQAGLFPKKIITVVDTSVFIMRYLFHIECCDVEHLSSPFTITACYYGSMQIEESLVIKILVYGKCHGMPYPEHCSECVGSETEVRNISEELHRMTFFLKRICFGIAPAVNLYFLRNYLNTLTLPLGFC